MKQYGKLIGFLMLITILLVMSGCDLLSKNKDNDKNPVPVAENTNVIVYYLKDTQYNSFLVREIHTLPKTDNMPKTAVEELINGTPTTQGAHKVLPADTKVLGVEVDDKGLATVDFSPEVLNANVGSGGETLGIASIVNTLTEFPNIINVSFTVNGKAENAMDWWGHVGLYEQPFSRQMSLVQEPLIWVTEPVDNQVISSPLKIIGSAMVFEATVSYRLKDEQGNILASGFSMASTGAPERGDFTAEMEFKSPGAGKKGQLEVFEVSMKDGSDINKVIIPVVFK
jgi:hypothetical protein